MGDQLNLTSLIISVVNGKADIGFVNDIYQEVIVNNKIEVIDDYNKWGCEQINIFKILTECNINEVSLKKSIYIIMEDLNFLLAIIEDKS